eukprot:COSAG05_NODE_2084_length_3598_cov_1.349528_3_plen_102_part_00
MLPYGDDDDDDDDDNDNDDVSSVGSSGAQSAHISQRVTYGAPGTSAPPKPLATVPRPAFAPTSLRRRANPKPATAANAAVQKSKPNSKLSEFMKEIDGLGV